MNHVSETLIGPLVAIEDREQPSPVEPYDVVVRVAGAGVCRTELHILRGELDTSLPHVLGHENAGYVAAVGEKVTTVQVGDPVVCYPFLSDGLSRAERGGVDSNAPGRVTPGIDAPGGFAEYFLSTERAMLRLPAGTDPIPFAPLTDAGLAAYRACRKLDLAPGATVVVTGVGGLGHLAIQILRAISAVRIVAVDPRPAARQLASECGADVAVAPDDLPAALDAPAAAAVDFVGSDESLRASFESLGFGGHLVAVGVGGNLDLPILDVVTTERKIEGTYVGTYQDLAEVTDLAVSGAVRPSIVRYPLNAAAQALADLAAGDIVGRAVLIP